jgi:hypothetical protein
LPRAVFFAGEKDHVPLSATLGVCRVSLAAPK